MLGDFNAITNNYEKIGGRQKPASLIEGFINFINRGLLVDMGYVGHQFTWCNRNFAGTLIKERIDRALVSSQWRVVYAEARLHHLDDNGSDHCPLLLDANPIV